MPLRHRSIRRRSTRAGVALIAIAATLGVVAPAQAADAGVPGAPTATTAHAGVNQAKVSWQPPTSDGGSAVTGYTATASPGGQTCAAASTATSCTVTGLSNGASYTFTVTATNAAGTSEPSAPTAPVTPSVDTHDPVLVSSSVTPARVSSLGGTVTVELRITDDLSGVRTPSGGLDANPAILFSRTDNTGSSIGFTRAMRRVSGDEYDGIYRATTSIPSGTSPGSWDLTVYPIDDNAGNSTFFVDRPGIMVGSPAAPSDVTATADAARNVTISWAAPTDDGGNAITGYRVSGPGGKTFTATSTTLTTSAYADWPSADPVSFTVTALNAAGASPESARSSALVIPAAASSAPVLVSLERGDGQATGTWKAPASSGGDPILTYELVATPGGRSCTTTALTCTITGLTNGQQYAVAVTATNSGGRSAASEARTVVPATTPSTPGAPQVTAESRTLAVTWSAPADQGGQPVTSYDVAASSDNGASASCTTAQLSCVLTGVADGLWTVTVTATNAVGSSTPSEPSSATRVDVTGPAVAWTAQPSWAAALSGAAAIAWSGTDVSTVDHYLVERRTAAGGRRFGPWQQTMQDDADLALALPAGTTTCVRVAGVDGLGNTGPFSADVCRTAPVDDRAAKASGKVKRLSGASYVARTASKLARKGSAIVFSGVRASTAQLLATTCPTCGKVQVLYGSKVVKTVSLRSSRTTASAVIALPSATKATSITLRSASGKPVVIDGLVLRAR